MNEMSVHISLQSGSLKTTGTMQMTGWLVII